MKQKCLYLVLTVLAIALIGMATISTHVDAEVSGDSNFRFRYDTTSTTPITDINYLNGVTSNVQDQIDAAGTGTLTDTYVFVGNGSNVATGVAVSGDATMANTGALSLASNSVDSAEIAANAVGASELNYLVSTVDVASSGTSGTATVPVNSVIVGAYPFANISDSTTDFMNTASISSTTLTVTLLGAATDDLQYKVVTVAP
jgi:hypothetical protein